jgi:hypothetical protein
MEGIDRLILKIAGKIEKEPFEYQAYDDLYRVAKEQCKTNRKAGIKWLKWLAERCSTVMPGIVRTDVTQARKLMDLHRRVLLAAAQDDFD